MDRPAGVVDFTPDPSLYPFESRWFESSVGAIHYIDEGEGQPLLLMHGNPDWSFLYRQMIPLLTGHFRCIAPDIPGFGLSAHPDPASYGYMPEDHANALGELVTHLDLTDMLVMGQDWGGPISMDIASRQPERVAGLVQGNTWFWPTDDTKAKIFSRLMGTPPFQWLITERNFFVNVALKQSLQAPVSDAEMAHYAGVQPTPESRRGSALLPIAIRTAEPWLAELERRVQDELADKPMLLIFGRKDRVLGATSFSKRWQRTFPHARLVELPDAGHFFQHDEPEAAANAIIAKYRKTG